MPNSIDKKLEKILEEYGEAYSDYHNDIAGVDDGSSHAKFAIESLIDEARIDEINQFLAIKVSHPEAYATAIAIHADRRLDSLKAPQGEKE